MEEDAVKAAVLVEIIATKQRLFFTNSVERDSMHPLSSIRAGK